MPDLEISRHWTRYQPLLFPALEQELDTLTDSHRKLILILDVLRLERTFLCYPLASTGRMPKDRLAIARSFVAKAVLQCPTTEALIDRLKVDKALRRICGWESKLDVPCKATFSNGFAEFAELGITEKIHADLIKATYADRIVGNVCRDSTAVEAREKATRKEIQADDPASAKAVSPRTQDETASKKKRGRPKKGEEREAEPTRIERQMFQPLDEMVGELSKVCDFGAKTNAQGIKQGWKGYKWHVDVDDNGVPLSCLLTSASVHDSQVAIPLETLTAQRVVSLYSLMDKAYDATPIRFFIECQGKVPVIDPKKPRGGEAIPLDPAKAQRYKARTTVERTYSVLKDYGGARFVRVRGPEKIAAHLMFGTLVVAATQILHYLV
jgi:transposase